MDTKSARGGLTAHRIGTLEGVLLQLHIQPGASKTAWKGLYESTPPRMKLSVQSPPVDGAANEAVVAFIAKTLGVPRSKIEIVSGTTSRQKSVWIEGVTVEDVSRKIGLQT